MDTNFGKTALFQAEIGRQAQFFLHMSNPSQSTPVQYHPGTSQPSASPLSLIPGSPTPARHQPRPAMPPAEEMPYNTAAARNVSFTMQARKSILGTRGVVS